MKAQILFLYISTLLFLFSFQNFASAQSRYWLGEERKKELKDFVRLTDSLVDYGEYERALLRYQEFFDLDCNEKPDAEKDFKMAYLSHWGKDLVEKYAPALFPFISLRDELVLGFSQGDKFLWLFFYINRMNEILKQEDLTFLLFEEMEEENKMKAMISWPLLKKSAIDYKRYDLLEKYDYDVVIEFDELMHLNKIFELCGAKDSIADALHDQFIAEEIIELLQVGLALKDTSGVIEVQGKAKKNFGSLKFDVPLDSIPFIEID